MNPTPTPQVQEWRKEAEAELMELARQYAHCYFNTGNGTATHQPLSAFEGRLRDAVRAALAASPQGVPVQVEPVAWRWRKAMTKEHWQLVADWGDWHFSEQRPQGPADEKFQIEALCTRQAAEHPAQNWQRLYTAVNELMAHMGAHGSAEAKGDRASAVMDALHAIDDGWAAEHPGAQPDTEAQVAYPTSDCVGNDLQTALPKAGARE